MSPLTPVSLNRANKTNSGYKYDPGLAKAVGKKLLGEYYTEENLENWNNSEITLFRSVLTGTIPSMYIKRFKTIHVKCADLNKYTFSLLNIAEKVYLFKSAHFI